MEELDSFRRTGPDKTVAAIHRALKHGLNRIDPAAA
jgi:diketogulonate reductase-like aldo/keto reductase